MQGIRDKGTKLKLSIFYALCFGPQMKLFPRPPCSKYQRFLLVNLSKSQRFELIRLHMSPFISYLAQVAAVSVCWHHQNKVRNVIKWWMFFITPETWQYFVTNVSGLIVVTRDLRPDQCKVVTSGHLVTDGGMMAWY